MAHITISFSAVVIIVAAALLLQLAADAARAPATPEQIGMPGCNTTCGNLSVPYPFGMGPSKCHLPGFKLTCDTSRHPPKLLLVDEGAFFEVTEISLHNNTVRVTGFVFDMLVRISYGACIFAGYFQGAVPYSISTDNELILIGCNAQAKLVGNGQPASILSGCSSFCPEKNGTSVMAPTADKYCYGTGCCQARISMSADGMPTGLEINAIKGEDVPSMHAYALIAKEGWFDRRRVSNKLLQEYSQRGTKFAPIVLDWEILHPANARSQHPHCPFKLADNMCKSKHSHCKPGIRGYTCHCNDGYDGNPYLIDGGCTGTGGSKSLKGKGALIGVASGAGMILLVFIAFFIFKKLKHQRARMLKRKFFKQNRGQLLKQLVSQRADIAERMIISLEELEKATNNFDKARELGGGGHGTVYKGILSDLHVVAIKKPKKVVQKEIDEFINEVAILSQINHRNIVKLYGCCLETEVPMLVYEFISNGTLYDHLHAEGPRSLAWDNRLRIAIETAKSLAYLHSTASVPIIHRDIKSVNILLDDTLTAKVADFGASRYISVEKSGLTTMVQGTFGYLDPMYFYTGRLTEKSDVYSFGVMLVELLTKKKPFSYLSSEGDGLVAHFTTLFGEGNLSEILDPQVTEKGGNEVQEVVRLAVACIKLTGDDRPTMRQVELTLEGLRSSMQLVSNNVVDDISRNFPSTTDRRSGEESTRQYSMEQEFMLSARYSR